MLVLRASVLLLCASFTACAGSSTAPDQAQPSADAAATATQSAAPAQSSEAGSGEAKGPSSVAPLASASAAPALEPLGVCDPAKRKEALAALNQATPFLEQLRREQHPSKEEWERNLAALLFAAEAGLLEAQYQYGKALFGARFGKQTPQKDEEADYVRALQFVRAAAVRGHEPARALFPDLAEAKLPSKLATPLQDVPRAWVVNAVKNADEWVAKCR
jgi:TPR repeat protein